MAVSPAISEICVEKFVFPSAAKAPGSNKRFFLGGAGVREIEVPGRSIKISAVGVYLEESAIPALAGKWKGKTASQLVDSVEFFRDIVTGPFEKFTQVTMLVPLTGQQYSQKVTDHCVSFWKAIGIYTEEEAKAVQKFLQVFQDENMPPGQSILYTQSPHGSLTIGFSKHDDIPEVGKDVVENKILSESIVESLIGKDGISLETKLSLATRVAELLNNEN